MAISARDESGGLGPRLAAWLAERAGDPGLRVEGLRRLAGGASRELWAFEAVGSRGDGRTLVLRRDPPGREGDAGDRAAEAALLAAAAEVGVPVPRLSGSCGDPSVLGTPFFVMDRVEGESLPRRLLRDPEYAGARRVLAAQLGGILARIHAIDPARPELAGLGGSTLGGGVGARERREPGGAGSERGGPRGPGAPQPSGAPGGAAPALAPAESAPRAEVLRVGRTLRQLAPEPHPILELAERWLLERAPAGGRRALVHGDYRVGNLIFGPEGVRAILDWELAHVGDPLEDLGWLCTPTWRFGGTEPVGGVGSREELVEAYEKAGGDPVDREALAWWEAFGSFKVALVWVVQSRAFLDGRAPSVELAAVGRRTAEPEAELLRRMEDEMEAETEGEGPS